MTRIGDFATLFLNQVPMLDLRAPVEFAKGAFPGVNNIPLLDDEERAKVGIRYQQAGNEKAIELGHQLIWGERKARRLQQWIEFVRVNPSGCLYCFRGGQRSKIVQQWLADEGIDYPRVSGGYKAMRRYLMAQTEQLSGQLNLILLGGRTGVGKTEVLLQLSNHIDLEGLANHRGSSFGRLLRPQPSQIDFEHPLAIALMKLKVAGATRLVLEDESRSIGRRAIPTALWQQMQKAPVVMLEDSMASRIERTRVDYVDRMAASFMAVDSEQGLQHFETQLRDSLSRISERLGGEGFKQLSQLMDRAFERQRRNGDTSAHEAWIARLLTDYYDPMYDYQINNKQHRICFSGDAEQVTEYLQV